VDDILKVCMFMCLLPLSIIDLATKSTDQHQIAVAFFVERKRSEGAKTVEQDLLVRTQHVDIRYV